MRDNFKKMSSLESGFVTVWLKATLLFHFAVQWNKCMELDLVHLCILQT